MASDREHMDAANVLGTHWDAKEPTVLRIDLDDGLTMVLTCHAEQTS